MFVCLLLSLQDAATSSLVSRHLSVIQHSIDYLMSVQFPSKNYPSSLESSDRDRLVQWCHGAPGFVHLWSTAYRVNRMTNIGSVCEWLLEVVYVCEWLLEVVYVCEWLLEVVYVCEWLLEVVYVCEWLLEVVYVCEWLLEVVYVCEWLLEVVYVCEWLLEVVCVCVNGY